MVAKTILIPWCVETGGIPHYVREQPSDEGERALCHVEGYRTALIEWRKAAPFEPPSPTAAVSWCRGRSAANLILGGPVLRIDGEGTSWAREVRPTFYLTQAGVLGLLKAGAFDGPTIRKGVKLMPVKRGQNYLVEVVS